jgi:hypothetical protein
MLQQQQARYRIRHSFLHLLCCSVATLFKISIPGSTYFPSHFDTDREEGRRRRKDKRETRWKKKEEGKREREKERERLSECVSEHDVVTENMLSFVGTNFCDENCEHNSRRSVAAFMV